jgi:hypothetical protein
MRTTMKAHLTKGFTHVTQDVGVKLTRNDLFLDFGGRHRFGSHPYKIHTFATQGLSGSIGDQHTGLGVRLGNHITKLVLDLGELVIDEQLARASFLEKLVDKTNFVGSLHSILNHRRVQRERLCGL